jgi:hypothetical protein
MRKQSIVELVFDDKLVSFIEEMQTTFRRELIILSNYTTEIDDSMKLQEELRVFMIRNQHKLTFTSPTFRLSKHPPSHPVLFALFIHVISDISLCRTINDAMLQIDAQSLSCPASWLEYDEDNIVKGTCGCGHGNINIENLYIVTNYETQLRCFVGCGCIKKHELITKDILKQFKKEVKSMGYCVERNYQKDHPDQRCDICTKPHKNDTLNRCNPCRIGRCDGCSRSIDTKYNRCYSCNEKRYQKELTSKCLECKVPIKRNFTRCYGCNIGHH